MNPGRNPERDGGGAGALDRALPHSPDAERALLGSMLLEKEAIGEAIAVLRDTGRAAFFLERHQQLYNHVVELYDQGKPIDGVVIKDELIRRGQFEALGGYDFLAGLINSVPSALRAREYARIVLEKALLRQLIGATHQVMQIAYDDAQPAQEILDTAEQQIFHVTEQRVSGGAQSFADLIKEVFMTIEARGENYALTGEPTGFYELDEMTCGMQPAELIIVAGRPSMGKTAFGLNMAEHLAIMEKRPTLFFSLEMSRQQVAQRVLCSRARVDSHRLRRGRQSAHDIERLQAAADEISRAPLFVDDTSSMSILELRARARMAYRKYGVRAIFVDYLQLMHAPNQENRQREVAEISGGLKALAKELKLPVVAMAQLNRNTENPQSRRGSRPRMSDLRESGSIEQDADVVLLLHREAYYKSNDPSAASEEGGVSNVAPPEEEDNTAEVIIAKQRNGPVGTITLHYNRQWTRFDNHKPGGNYESVHVRDFGE